MGDSTGLTLIIIAAIIVVVLIVAFVISRRPGRRTPKPREPQRRPRVESGERPVHLDPDPDRMAGGRARFVPPFGERQR